MTWLTIGILYLVSATMFYVVATKTAATEPVLLQIEPDGVDLDRAA